MTDKQIKKWDEETADKIERTCNSNDTEGDHADADRHIIDLLKRLGFHATVREWGRVSKWYA